MNSFCYIQARGGSKRIKNKNLQEVGGKPMVAHAIEKAQEAAVFDLIVLNSDSLEILKVAEQHHILKYLRPAQLATDNATDNDVATDIVRAFPDYDIACCLYPCVPLLSPESIRESYQEVEDGVGLVMAVKEYPHPIQRAMTQDGHFIFHGFDNARTQDLPPRYYDPGAFTIFRTDLFRGKLEGIEPRTTYELGMWEHFDIDWGEDLDFVRRFYEFAIE